MSEEKKQLIDDDILVRLVAEAKLQEAPPSELQNILQKLERESKKSKYFWKNKKNVWIRDLNSMEIGKVGEELAEIYFKGKRTNSVLAGYDVEASGMKIEIKTCTMRVANDYPLYNWQQIRVDNRYSHLALIAILPDEVRCFLVPQSEIPFSSLKKQKNTDTYELPVRKLEGKWFSRFEIKCLSKTLEN